MTLPTEMLTIRRADITDQDAVAQLLACAFHGGDLAGWLVPNPAERARVYPRYFAILAEHALNHGRVDLVDELGHAGVAVWYEYGAGPLLEPEDYPERLATAVADHLSRFQALDASMHARHPTGRTHHYLAFLAVHPDAQGHGLGGHLLRHHHWRLDAERIPAYLEATGPRNRRLYRRHGYEDLPPYEITAGGPELLPMWRNPDNALPPDGRQRRRDELARHQPWPSTS